MNVSNSMKIYYILNTFAAALLFSGTDVLAQEKSQDTKRVLALFIFKQGLPWPYYIEQSMRAALGTEAISNIKLNVEYADQTGFPEKLYRSRVIDLYRYKYSEQEMDLILVFGGDTVELMAEYGDIQSVATPVLLITTDQKSIERSRLKPNMRSMTWGVDIAATGSLVQDLLPKTKNLFVITGTSQIDLNLKNLAVEELDEFDDRFTIHYLDDLAAEELLLKVAQLPGNSAILFLSYFRDANGETHVPRDFMSIISKNSNSPVFGMVDTYMGHGIVGGELLSAELLGRQYVEVTKKILQGDRLTDLKSPEIASHTIFDWRQLERWSINEDRLPAGSIVRYRESSIWEDHKWDILGVTIIIISQTFALLGLLVQLRRRRQAEKEAQRLRDERARISRVLSMGEIAASLAHELNQPLSAIRSFAQAAQRFLNNDPSEPDEAGKALVGIVAGNRRAEEVIKRIRMALKKEPFERSRVEVTDITHEVIMLVQNMADEQNISLWCELAASLPPVYGDRIQLQQVLFNLIINGIEAISNVVGPPREIVVQALRLKPDAVTISVRDSGIGIDEKQGGLLFDAFYTTKREGMGIGLSISRSIIEDHGGRLWATRNTDKGSTFSFTVPVYEEND